MTDHQFNLILAALDYAINATTDLSEKDDFVDLAKEINIMLIPRTVEGDRIREGDNVWTHKDCHCGCGGKWEQHTVKKVHQHKVEFVHEDSQGYIGAKLSIVYSNPTGEQA